MTDQPENQGVLTLEQYNLLQDAYADAVLEFHGGYTDAYAAAVAQGLSEQDAIIKGLEGAHNAQQQAFLAHYAATNNVTDSALRAAYADAAVTAGNRADNLASDLVSAEQKLATYSATAWDEYSTFIGNNPIIQKVAKHAGPVGDAADIAMAWASGDSGELAKALVSAALGAAAAALATAAVVAFGVPALVAGIVIAGVAVGASLLTEIPSDQWWDNVAEYFGDRWDELKDFADNLSQDISDLFDQARNWIRRVDPLVLDLDGDGIETIGADGSVLFDHDGDGVSNGTGWIKSDDGILVLDRNGNGVIDDGSELFGDQTEGSELGLNEVTDRSAGLRALEDLDTNHDDRFDASDAQYGAVRVWRDLNQDGVSQSNELFTLAELGIAAINLDPGSTSDVNLGNGNVVDSSGSYVRTDGTTGALGDLLLRGNNFYRRFDDPIELTEEARKLPNLNGSGMVRDLAEAASLDSDLVAAVAALTVGMSRSEMIARMDEILSLWADTSEMASTAEQVRGRTEATELHAFGSGTTTEDLTAIISILERFSGSTFFRSNSDGSLGVNNRTFTSALDPDAGGPGVPGHVFSITLDTEPTRLLLESYDQLKMSVYGALVLQTRLRDHMRDIEVTFESNEAVVNVSKLLTRLQSGYLADNKTSLEDAGDILRYAGIALGEASFALQSQVEAWAFDLAATEAGRATLESVEIVIVNGSISLSDAGGYAIGGQAADTISGRGGRDIISAAAGNDYLQGNGGSDQIDGGQGDDQLYGGDGNDLLIGGAGTDQLYGGNENDLLLGGEGNDRLYGAAGNDTLRGEAGDDILQGELGSDRLDGGIGNDSLYGGSGNTAYIFRRGDGNDIVHVSHDVAAVKNNVLILGDGIIASDITLGRVYDNDLGGDGALQVTVTNVNGTADTITFNGFLYSDDTSNPYNGLQFIHFSDGTVWTLEDITTKLFAVVDGSIRGTVGDDALHGTSADNVLNGVAGNDSLFGEEGSDQLFGGTGNDGLNGGAGNDALDGGAGNDVLDGGIGNDNLNGGMGNNVYAFGHGDGQDVISSFNDDTAAKSNVLRFKAGVAVSDVKVLQVGGSYWGAQDLVLKVGAAGDSVTIRGFFDQDDPSSPSNPLQRVEFADGTIWTIANLLAAIYAGTDAADQLYGTSGGDAITGGLGGDTLYGRAGDDVLNGGAANDTLSGDAGNDSLSGGDGDDTLQGGDGNDALDGGSGNDRLNGGAGDNTYHFGRLDGQDSIDLSSGSSVAAINTLSFKAGVTTGDLIFRQVSTSFGNSDLEISIAGGSDKITIRGFIANDDPAHAGNPIRQFRFADGTVWDLDAIKARLYAGTSADDSLRGTLGDDAINGADGNDVIAAGTGADVIMGGAGNDSLDGQQDNDALLGGAGDDFLHGCDGDDILDGGAGNDRLVGNAGINVFRFGRGDGQDIILDNSDQGLGSQNALELKAGISVSDVVLRQVAESGSQALTGLEIRIAGTTDSITINRFFEADDPLNSNNPVQQLRFADGTVWGIDAILAKLFAGTSSADLIYGTTRDDAINGSDGDDILHGVSGNDVLAGGAGNDQLWGDAGSDTLQGGQGDDRYVVDDVGDVVVETSSEGNDTIESSVSYAISQNVEKLVLTGSADISGTGGTGNDAIFGNSGANALVGGAGDDSLDGGSGVDNLTGGAGNDAYFVDNSSDVVVEQSAEGTDVIHAYSDYTLSANVEKLILIEGSGAYQGTGNAGNEIIIGNSSDNRLDGAAGADQLMGGAGNDTYVVDNAGDQVVEAANEGSDTVESSVSYTLGATLENLTLVGNANLDGTGNDQNNTMAGNAGNNRLDGGLGSDDLYGAEGNDYFIANEIGDWIYEYEGEGLDTVERRFETNLILSDNVENLILATGIQTGNGNDLENLITGNSGDNRIAGLEGDDELLGLDGNDAMWGGGGSDRLIGAAGDDYLDGSEGVDHLEGGSGNDVYITDDAGDVVIEAAAGGTDQVQTTASYALSTNIENLFLMGDQAIDGTGNALANYMAGNAANNVLNGMAGNDTLVGDGGGDTLIGGAGDDDYVVAVGSGTDIIDNTGGGFDGVFFEGTVTREQLSFSRSGDDLLITIDNSATPAVRVTNHFLGGDAAIDFVQPGPAGSFYLTTTEINQIVAGGGSGYDQVIEGTAAGEQLVGGSGKDLIKGLAGEDELFGMGGNDTLQGGDGDDYLAGGNGSGTGSNADRLEGGAGNDTLSGEDGANVLIGGANNDSYVYGGGQDTIDNTGGGYDGVFFNDGITTARLGFTRDGDDLLITVDADANTTVRVTGHFLGGDYAIDFVQPASGATLDTAAINALVGGTPPGGDDDDYPSVVTGTASGEQLLGTNGRDLIKGLGGADQLFGFSGDDKLDGGDGDDYLSGGNGSAANTGNDILIGGAGVDTLVGEDGNDQMFGGLGNDKYVYGGGADTIDNTGGGTDWLFFNSSAYSVDRSRITFHQDGDDLIVRVDADVNKQVRVTKHFLGGEYALAYVQPAGGNAIPASQFGGLLVPLQSEAPMDMATYDASGLADIEGTPATSTWIAEAPVYGHTPILSVEPERVGHGSRPTTGGDQQSLPGSGSGQTQPIPTGGHGSTSPTANPAPPVSAGHNPGVIHPSSQGVSTGGNLPGAHGTGQESAEPASPSSAAWAQTEWQRLMRSERYQWRYHASDATESGAELESLIAAMASFSPGAATSGVLHAGNESIRHQMMMASPL